MKSIVLLGATSFIGKAIISSNSHRLPIKAVARSPEKGKNINQVNISWYEVDLFDPNSLESVLEHGDIIINLVYMHDKSEKDNKFLLKNILESCKRKGVSRMIYCSTAGVVGATKDLKVNEVTPCVPVSNYEKTKYNLEQQLFKSISKTFDIGILRPTCVVGPGGQSLLKLALDLKSSSWLVNYLRASLFGSRPMHLVSVNNVANALLHLAFLKKPLNKNIYIVSSDEDPNNNFKKVEECLMQAMGIKKRSIPLIPIPLIVLSLILRLRRRSHFNMSRKYDSTKLRLTGFVEASPPLKAVHAFGISMK